MFIRLYLPFTALHFNRFKARSFTVIVWDCFPKSDSEVWLICACFVFIIMRVRGSFVGFAVITGQNQGFLGYRAFPLYSEDIEMLF